MAGEFDFRTFEARKNLPGVETGLPTRVECRTPSRTTKTDKESLNTLPLPV